MTKGTCNVEGCGTAVHARKLCNMHYRRHLASQADRCSIDECDGPAIALDLCPKHYTRLKTHGSPHAVVTRTPQPRPECGIDGCDKPASARSWCKRHYERWRLHGDPLATARKPRPWAIVDPDQLEYRECLECSRTLPIFEFASHRTRPERVSSCRKCTATSRRERLGPNPRDKHHYKVMLKFGLSDAEYRGMTEAQSGLCAICGSPPYGGRKDARKKYLALDHCHATGKVRALLCDGCNMGLGLFKDDPERLIAAAEYILKHRD